MNNRQAPDKEMHISKFIPGIAWFFLVLILVCIPGYDLPKVDNWLIEINFDKFIHVGLFAVLAYLFMLPIIRSALPQKEKWNYIIKITLATIIWGITTELIQKYFVPSRSFNLSDCAADGLGGFIALLFCKRRMSKSKETKKNNT